MRNECLGAAASEERQIKAGNGRDEKACVRRHLRHLLGMQLDFGVSEVQADTLLAALINHGREYAEDPWKRGIQLAFQAGKLL